MLHNKPQFQGSAARLSALSATLGTVARQAGWDVIDAHRLLTGVVDYYAPDGIHMCPEGQDIVAAELMSRIGK